MKYSAKHIAIAAAGIALYVVISMLLKIPLGVGHIMLDLGYIVFAVYCYIYGAPIGALVGTGGCILVSLISTAYFPIGWALGQALIGVTCGIGYRKLNKAWMRVLLTIVMVFIGVAGIKTVVESAIWGIPFMVKLAKNLVAASTDAVVMAIGVCFAPKIDKLVKGIRPKV